MEAANGPHDDSSSTLVPPLIYDDNNILSQDQPPPTSVDSMAADPKRQLEDAIRNNHPDELKILLDSGDDLLDILIEYELDKDGEIVKLNLNPLALAAALGQTSVLELLLERNADVNAEVSGIGGTVLHLAARCGRKEIVGRLLSKGAEIDQRDYEERSPLHLASIYGTREIVACLLDAKADFGLLDNEGHTPFHLAAMYGKLETLQLLYKRGSNKYINEGDNYSNAPLHLAVLNNRDDTVQWLLNSGTAIDQPGYRGQPPLTMACGNIEIVNLLVNSGADVHKTDNGSLTPILSACLNANLEVFRRLQRYHASVSDIDIDGDTCFHMVITSKEERADVIEAMLTRLVGAGADINQPNRDGHSPLYLACWHQKPQHAKFLLELGADINQKSSIDGTTALIAACCQPDEQIVNMLLQRNPDMAAKNHHGRTALGLACKFNYLNHVKALLGKGSKAIVPDRHGITPLCSALRLGHIEIALELLPTEEYYPRNLTAKIRFTEQISDDANEIASELLKYFGKGKFEALEQLHVVMYWAVSNRAAELVKRCITHNPEVLQWSREGDTWLHVASDSGALEITELLLDRVAKKPEQPAEWANAAVIIKHNSQGDSPLTISIDRGHNKVQKLFWEKIRQLRETDTAFIKMYSAAADWILELLARYEKPGGEDILMEFLQRWYDEDVEGPKHNTALHWAVQRRKVVVVWWLLSKGGYSSGNAIESAQELVPGPYDRDDICGHIRNLLLHPPPILDHIPNPNKEHRLTFQGIDMADGPELVSPGTIVDFLSCRKSISIRYARPKVRDIIYKVGPESLMKEAKDDLRQRDLNVLRNTLRQSVPGQDGRAGGPVPSWVTSISSQQNDNDQEEHLGGSSRGDLLVRWIHLPVNELHLMRDLASRVSYDSKRSEIDHIALMKHFNRSWGELAAGGGRYYMKPQCVQQQKQTEQDDNSNNGPSGCERSGGYTGCIALYMPYLTIGSYDPGAHGRRTTVSKGTGKPGNSRNSKQIKHTPMTLDQYYYPTIINTSERDNDQVLSKFLQKKHEQPSKAEKKILMVNHLWVWIIDEKTIITATTDASNQESSGGLDQKTNGRLLEDALRNILRNENGSVFEGATSIYSVMELILSIATGLFVEKSVTIPKQSPKGPVEIFRDSIRDVANREASLFKDFLYGLQEARRQQGPLPEQQLDHKSQSRPAPLSRYHVISSETELLYEIRDIRDELHILRSLAEDQEVVWQQAFPSYRMKNESSRFEFCTPTDVKKDLDVMLLEADKIEGYINTLLDLRQAEFGRLQAYDSARLSKIIFVFTVVTIVFLPLSFLSSLFALDVSVFPHEAGSLKYQGWWLFPILFGVTTIVSVPTLALAWNVNAISAKLSPQKKVEYDDTTPHRNEPTRWGKLRRRLRGKDDKNGKNGNGIPLHETI